MRTDFEKLQIAKLYIKELKIEIGELKSEVDELTDERNKLRQELGYLKALSSSDRVEIKRGHYYEKLKKEISDLSTKLGKYKKDNERLMHEKIMKQL